MKKFAVHLILTSLTAGLICSSSAFANKEDAGTIIGGIIGGIIGNKADNGRAGGTVAGAIIGALIGNAIGEDLDDQDREELAEAQAACLNGETQRQHRWGRSGRANGEFVCVEGVHRRTKTVCREVRSVTYHRGKKQERSAYYCKTRGNWTSVDHRDVEIRRTEPRPSRPRLEEDGRSQGVSLLGYCPDKSHKQFYAAKEFAYNTMNLGMNDAVNWASQYNETHRCGTISEFAARFEILLDLTYNVINLNMTDARTMALSKVETTSVEEAQFMKKKYLAIHNLTYNVMNLSFSEARSISIQWINRERCESALRVRDLTQEYQREFDFAYNGMNRSYSDARSYAVGKIRRISVCGDLLSR